MTLDLNEHMRRELAVMRESQLADPELARYAQYNSELAAGGMPEMGVAASSINPQELRWKRDPVAWLTERAHVETWSKQQEIIGSVVGNPKTAVHSCHEIGKSWIASATACWWIDVHPPGEAFVVTTAPTDQQVKAVLWREINKMHTKVGLRGRTNLSEWYLGQELVALGRKPSEHNPTAFQGIHARYILVVLDEACGIPQELWDAASTLAANEHGRMLCIGNPDDPQSEFARVCQAGSGWNTIHVGYQHTPNFTNEPVSRSLSEMLIHPNWVDDRKKKWGEESALFVSKCEGNFPKDFSPFAVVPFAWATRCRYNELTQPDVEDTSRNEAGIDVGAGGDRTIIYERRGAVACRFDSFQDPDPMKTVGRLVEKINAWQITKVKIDSIGIGWALAGRLRELSGKHNMGGQRKGETTHNAEIVTVNFGAGPTPGLEKLFQNKRAEVWWNVGREKARLGAWDLTTVSDDLILELTTPMYEIMDSLGKIKIEAKDEVKKRLPDGRSPDLADALLLAFYDVNTEATLGDGLRDMVQKDLTLGLNPI